MHLLNKYSVNNTVRKFINTIYRIYNIVQFQGAPISSWRIYKPQHAILLRTLSQAAGIKSSTWFEISSRQRWTRLSPKHTVSYIWLILSLLQYNCYTTGPRVSKDALLKTPNTRQIVFLKLTIHHNNKNKSINFIFKWNLANQK